MAALTIGLVCVAAPGIGQVTGLPAHVQVRITGDPATPQYIAAQVGAAIGRSVQPDLEPGAVVTTLGLSPAPQPLAPGFLTSFTVRLVVNPGAGAAPISATTIADVVNVATPKFAPPRLSFRDDPERITADGVLSRTTVLAGTPSRIYYYHQNTLVRRRFCVVLTANGSVHTHLHVISAAAGPNIDVMSVGHAVSKTFLAQQPLNEGSIVMIAGGRPVVTRDDIVGPGDGIVGAVDLRVLDGGPVTLTVMAIPVDADPAGYLNTVKLPDDGHGRHGDFRLAGFAQRIIAFTAGGPDAAYVYGQRQTTLPAFGPADAGRDYGDYGVLQAISFDLANPTNTPVTVFLYEKPLGGVVRSSFLVNGVLTDVGCVRVPRHYAVGSYALGAHATAALDVLTMTDGGSNYPLEIGVTSTPPLPATPAMRAAEGCFPARNPMSLRSSG